MLEKLFENRITHFRRTRFFRNLRFFVKHVFRSLFNIFSSTYLDNPKSNVFTHFAQFLTVANERGVVLKFEMLQILIRYYYGVLGPPKK